MPNYEPPPAGCVWKRAIHLQPGDKVWRGSLLSTVHKVEYAKWADGVIARVRITWRTSVYRSSEADPTDRFAIPKA